MEEKRCPKCETWKPKSDFGKDKHRLDGKSTYCRHCIRSKHKGEYIASKRKKAIPKPSKPKVEPVKPQLDPWVKPLNCHPWADAMFRDCN